MILQYKLHLSFALELLSLWWERQSHFTFYHFHHVWPKIPLVFHIKAQLWKEFDLYIDCQLSNYEWQRPKTLWEKTSILSSNDWYVLVHDKFKPFLTSIKKMPDHELPNHDSTQYFMIWVIRGRISFIAITNWAFSLSAPDIFFHVKSQK